MTGEMYTYVRVLTCARWKMLLLEGTFLYSRNCMTRALKEIQLWRCKVGDAGTTHLVSLYLFACTFPGAI